MAQSEMRLSATRSSELLKILKNRFEKNPDRRKSNSNFPKGLEWSEIQSKLESKPKKLWSLNEMEESGGEPDVADYDKKSGAYIFYDCAAESPKGRRSLCYDPDALASRKEHKPRDSAWGMATDMGIDLLTEEEFRLLQTSGKYDTKTSSWLRTPADIRERGGAIFGDWRYGHVFVYHNGAESYYAARGFRGALRV